MRDPITADRARRRTVGGSRRRLLPALGTWAFFLTFAGQGVRNVVGWWTFGLIAAVSEVVLLLVFLHEGHRVPRRALPPLTGAYTALCLVSVLWSQYPAATALAGALMLATTAAGVLLACGLSLREMTDALSRALEAILVLSILLELYVSLVLRHPLVPVYMRDWDVVPVSYYWVNGEILRGGPIQGIVGNRNPLAFIALLTLLCVAVRWADRRVRPFNLVVWSGLSVLVLALTVSATVLVAVVVCVVVTAVLWLMRHVPVARRRLVSGVALSLGVALAAAGLGLHSQVTDLLGRSPDLSGRWEIWTRVMGLWEQHTILGWGWIMYWPPWMPLFRTLVVRPDGTPTMSAHNVYVGNADSGQQQTALLVLNEETREAVEHLCIAAAIPFEEHLTLAENTTHAIRGYIAVFQNMQVIIPELVFNEECYFGSYQTKESPGIADGIKRQITDDVCTLIIFPNFVTRRRKESKQDAISRKSATNKFYQWAALLELT